VTQDLADYYPSPARFGRAVGASREARAWADVRAGAPSPQDPNPVAREFDACVITVLFTHAAIENEWY
jgi:hypothetical protein